MNHAHPPLMPTREPHILRGIRTADMNIQHFPSTVLSISPNCSDYLERVDQNRSLPASLINSTISELQSDAEENEDSGMDFQYTTPEPEKYKNVSWNNNVFSRTMNSHYQHKFQKASNEKEEDMGFDSRTSSNSPTYLKNMQTSAYKINRLSLSLNNNLEYVRHIKSHDHQRTRTLASTASLRTHFQRLSFFHNIKHKDIIFGSVIGKGGFGKVHTGYIQGHPVAIKVVQKRRGSGIHREILQAERLAFTLNLRHENIVSILAVNLCDGLRGDALIVMELASPQTLQSLLDDNTRTITQSQRIQFALQITKALRYLHSNDVAHLDVKPRNVLMTKEDTCKLADFGSLTRTRTDSPREETEFTQLLGTLPYRAPELMKGCFPSTKADIYSLGITFWQLVTRETPHSGANPHWLIYQVTKGNRRPDHHDTGSDIIEIKYRDHYVACWDANADLRPDATDLVMSLSTLLQCVWDSGWSDVTKRNE